MSGLHATHRIATGTSEGIGYIYDGNRAIWSCGTSSRPHQHPYRRWMKRSAGSRAQACAEKQLRRMQWQAQP